MTEVAVYTAGENCKKCYSCVRSCPTKAIEVHSGQADVIPGKCISCGYCVSQCSQGAKQIRSAVGTVQEFLNDPVRPCYVMIAPSFPAAYLDLAPERLVGGLDACGFAGVHEVAFGADLVSYEYHRRFSEAVHPAFLISSPCPAIVSFIEKLYPELLPFLAGVLSPMEAMARVIRERVTPRDTRPRVVFVGPCVAKKDEAQRSDLVDAVLTFRELQLLFEERDVDPSVAAPRDFDPPYANLGKIYPVTGGLLKAASIEDDLLESPVAVLEGRDRVTDLLKVLSKQVRAGQEVSTRFFDLLFCEGCIAGPVMPNDLTFYERKKYIVAQMKKRPLVTDIQEWARGHQDYLDLDLSRTFRSAKLVEPEVPESEIRKILAQTGKHHPEDELNCRACGYSSCRDKAVAVYRGIAEVEMCLPHLISQMEQAIEEIKSNQTRLIQAEKLASMGQMAAGIAHEINNPLGVVLMYAHLLKDELAEARAAAAGLEDVDRIIHEAERTRGIVKGILNFAREEKITRVSTDINALLREAAAGVAALTSDGQVGAALALDPGMGNHDVDPHQLRQVFDNIIKNAVEVMPAGGQLTVESQEGIGEFTVAISDTGPGVPEEHLAKLFSPFFTTKPIGKGTGLGLPVCYGIVKMHGGAIRACNRPEGGARFEITVRDSAPSSGDAP